MPDKTETVECLTSRLYYAQKDGCPNGHHPLCGKICYGCVEDALAQQEAEHERIRFRLYHYAPFAGTSHTTACSIWREDGQGHAEGFDGDRGPCNCGALENFERTRAEAAESRLAEVMGVLRECHAACDCSPTQMEKAIVFIGGKLAALLKEQTKMSDELTLEKKYNASLRAQGHIQLADARDEIATLRASLAEREMDVATLRYALQNLFALVQGESPSLLEDDHHYDMVQSALASTSSAAERVERRIGAKYLREAIERCNMQIRTCRETGVGSSGNLEILRNGLIRWADALDRPDGKEEGNG